MTAREQHVERLKQAKEELSRCTGWRKRDMYKHVKRLEKELCIYDRYHRAIQS